MPVAGMIGRFDMIIVVKIALMAIGELFLMTSVVRMTNGRSRLQNFDQMDVRTTIALMLMEKGRKAFSRCPGVKEKCSTRTATRECGSPSPCSCDPSHRAHRQRSIDRSRWLSTSGGLNKKAIFDLQVLESSRLMVDSIQEHPAANSNLPPSVAGFLFRCSPNPKLVRAIG
jgi:hypothetical protein